MSETMKFISNFDDDDDSIDLLAMARAVLKKWWLILLAGIVCGGIAYTGAKLLLTPTYYSCFTAYVNNQAEQVNSYVTSSDISASKDLTTTYAQIICSKPVIEAAIEKMDTSVTYEEVAGCVFVDTVDDTQIISVGAITWDPELSYELTKALEEVAPDKVQDIITASSMKIVTHAEYYGFRYGPSYKKYAALGFLLGAFVVIAIAILKFLLDTRIKSSDVLTDRYGIPVMGVIHDLDAKDRRKYGYYKKGK